MRVHHLNCATMCPYGGRFINGSGRPWERARIVCHCLLIETDGGLALVDTGFGLLDVANPRERLGPIAMALLQPRVSPAETAVRQVERLGFRAEDVRHIIVTHLDLDHAGGLSDFPWAKVHLLDAEYRGATDRATPLERGRYLAHQWAHGPKWVRYPSRGGEPWFGFECVRALDGLPPEVLLVPLIGHTRGHTAVGVADDDGRWLLHAGDSYFFAGEMDAAGRRCSPLLDVMQRAEPFDRGRWAYNQERLRDLTNGNRSRVRVFSAHDPDEFERFSGAS